MPLCLDQQGRDEADQVIERTQRRLRVIQQEADQRLGREAGVSVGILIMRRPRS
jgi:hypothetical protein